MRAESGRLEALAQATGGRVVTDPAELLAERSQPARSRVDLTTALMLAAMLLFLLDVALYRLPWERALTSVLTAAHNRPARPARPKKRTGAPPPAAPDTTSQLLAAKNARKRL
jgi:hypothetical protein